MTLIRPLTHAAIVAVALFTVSACSDDSGKAQKTQGKIESGVGSLTGNEELKREGKKNEVVGGVKSAGSELKGAIKDAND
ncbi:CsbD family protein [Caulobacter sp. NIBR2454]|uniref:CsbD family protein n=1 Tax=Caulobacter sp. NIBR2454 TaxID=3015996 RepID=UPI0022B68750|nr:CsbD family protein [Caulobacter sp. NIBR2454]